MDEWTDLTDVNAYGNGGIWFVGGPFSKTPKGPNCVGVVRLDCFGNVRIEAYPMPRGTPRIGDGENVGDFRGPIGPNESS